MFDKLLAKKRTTPTLSFNCVPKKIKDKTRLDKLLAKKDT